jgi:hypothetical protein
MGWTLLFPYYLRQLESPLQLLDHRELATHPWLNTTETWSKNGDKVTGLFTL